MIAKYILIFISLLKLSYNLYALNPEQFFKYVDEEKVDKSKLDDILKTLSKGLEEVYAFYTLSNNPPKTGYPDITHNKVNITEELLKIDTTNKNYYNFYQDFVKVFSKVKDGHTTITFKGLNSFTERLYKYEASIYFPIIFYIKNDTNGIPKMYGKPNKDIKLNRKFTNSDDIFNKIEKNINVPINLIKGKNPFDFINGFISQFAELRNPHGSFTQSFNMINKINLGLIPIYKENTTNFTVEYENGVKFETDLLFIFKENIFKNRDLTPVASIQNYFFDSKNFDKMINDFIFIPEVKEFPYELIKIDKYGKFKLKLDSNINSIKGGSVSQNFWDFSTDDKELKCRVDKENQLNVYLVQSFEPKSIDDFINTVKECSELFDKNNYKIIVIQSYNEGGEGELPEFLLEMVSPYISFNVYNRIRATENIKKNFKMVFQTIEKCKEQSQIDFFDKFNSVNYSNIKEDVTRPFFMADKKLKKLSLQLRKNMKNKRKPTDIMVFTDGFSFSATSIFIKYLQYYGGGIVVGYFGHPSKNTTFDSSLSPSGILEIDELSDLNTNFKSLKKKYSADVQFAVFQCFYDKDNFSVPLEYEVTPVDERISLYENFNESNYHIFAQKAKEIFKKYENECSKSKTNLFLLDNNCPLGGYPCVNGKWNKEKCVQFYCDLGYIFDKGSQKCIPDKCTEYSDVYYYIILSLIILSDLTTLVMIIYCCAICCCCKKRKIAPEGPLLS